MNFQMEYWLSFKLYLDALETAARVEHSGKHWTSLGPSSSPCAHPCANFVLQLCTFSRMRTREIAHSGANVALRAFSSSELVSLHF